jgi:hypothetical protein
MLRKYTKACMHAKQCEHACQHILLCYVSFFTQQYQAICFSICALDVGFENPVFASIEIEYGDADIDTTGHEAISAEKHLVYYQVRARAYILYTCIYVHTAICSGFTNVWRYSVICFQVLCVEVDVAY